jgi:Putative Actinobacterial Holin-X, holin superfamily III
MNVGSLLAALGFAVVKAEAQRAARRLGRNVAVAALTGLLLATAVAVAIAAFAVWLAGEVGTIAALSMIAGGLVVLAGVVQGIARIASSPRPAPPPPPIAERAVGPLGEPPPGSVLGSLAVVALVGFLLVRQILRR